MDRFNVRSGAVSVILDAIVQYERNEKTAAAELDDLIPVIDGIIAAYYWEHPGFFNGKLLENYKKCKKVLGLKVLNIKRN